MKNLFKIIALLIVAVFATGCVSTGNFNPNQTQAAQTTQKKAPCAYKKVIPYTAAGAAGGGALEVLGVKNATVGFALVGLMSGILRSETDCEHEETVRRVEERSGGKSAVFLRSQADEQEALDLFKECEDLLAGKSSPSARRSVPDCKKILARASDVRTEVATDKLIDKVYNVDGVSYGSSRYSRGYVDYWARDRAIRSAERRAYWDWWDRAGVHQYNRQNGYYR